MLDYGKDIGLRGVSDNHLKNADRSLNGNVAVSDRHWPKAAVVSTERVGYIQALVRWTMQFTKFPI